MYVGLPVVLEVDLAVQSDSSRERLTLLAHVDDVVQHPGRVRLLWSLPGRGRSEER